jgi:hypothetical protein
MPFEEVIEEQMHVLVAPDGTWQAMTLAPDFQTCVAQMKILHKAKMCESFHELVKVRGFEIIPVKVTMKQNGSAEEGFQRAKQSL